MDKKDRYEKRGDGWYLKGYSADAKPNLLRQVGEYFVLGRNYIDVVSKEDDRIVQIVPKKFALLFHLLSHYLRASDFSGLRLAGYAAR